MTLTTDDVYNAIKAVEVDFSLPAPYFVVHVGSLDARNGQFRGLRTTSETDPEPLQGDRPNPPPRFVGSHRVIVTVKRRRRTVTRQPAPLVPLAPVLVELAVSNVSTNWSVIVGGDEYTASPTQTSILINVWDKPMVRWRLTVGQHTIEDVVWFQRPNGPPAAAAGAFTIPLLPLTIVYSPPVDSLRASSATYTTTEATGSTVDFGIDRDFSSTVPVSGSMFLTSLSLAKGSFDAAALAMKVTGNKAASEAFSGISGQIGQVTVTEQTGLANGTETSLTLTQAASDELRATVTNGGPGVGDVFYFLRDLRMIWLYVDGRLRLWPLSYTKASITAGGLRQHAESIGIAAADAQTLLALDPLENRESEPAAWPSERFILLETLEYAFGGVLSHTFSMSRNSQLRRTQRAYKTNSAGWDAGPLLKALGLGGSETTTVSITNAVGTDTSATVSIAADLVSGPQERFLVNLWYDDLFGTFLFEQLAPSETPRLTGSGTGPAQQVTLRAAGKVYRTVTGADGLFQFHAPSIPTGRASLDIEGTTRSITIKSNPTQVPAQTTHRPPGTDPEQLHP